MSRQTHADRARMATRKAQWLQNQTAAWPHRLCCSTSQSCNARMRLTNESKRNRPDVAISRPDMISVNVPDIVHSEHLRVLTPEKGKRKHVPVLFDDASAEVSRLRRCGRGRRAVARLLRHGLRRAGGRRPRTGLGRCRRSGHTGAGYRYRAVEGWDDLPPGYTCRDGAAVCVERKDNVYVFNRGAHPIIVFDRDGKFLTLGARTSGSSTPTAPPWDRTTCFISPMISAPQCANARRRARWC
jgi:hypothetical protein